MKYIYRKIKEQLKKGQPCALATVVRQAGPSPRGAGAKCLIMSDGSIQGTVGGGLLEAQTLKKAKEVLEKGSPLRLQFSLKGEDVAETDMLCGGNAEVFIEPVSGKNESQIEIFKQIANIEQRGGQGIAAVLLDPVYWENGSVPRIFLTREGEKTGSFGPMSELEQEMASRIDQILKSRVPGIITVLDRDIYVEPVIADPTLYIFGGGHVSQQIVPLASKVGFKVMVIDDRPEFANPEQFPDAYEVKQLSFDSVMEKLPVAEDSYLVIVTRGHMHDKVVLAQALKTKARYIGMIGSKRKRDIIYEKLVEEGLTREDLARVYSPIGLDIGAETPEEIAVSIVAELIKVRAGV